MSSISQALPINNLANTVPIVSSTAQAQNVSLTGNDFATLLAAQLGANMVRTASTALDGTSGSAFSLSDLLAAANLARALKDAESAKTTRSASEPVAEQVDTIPAQAPAETTTTVEKSAFEQAASTALTSGQTQVDEIPGAFGLSVTNVVGGFGSSGIYVSDAGTTTPVPTYGEGTSATAQQAMERALSRIGDPYSQSMRGNGNYVDCSYLTQWAFQGVGIDIPGTAAEQARYCTDNGYLVSQDQIQPGDLVFWRRNNCDCGRYGEIHHVAIYLGDGKIVEASSSAGQVRVGDLWDNEDPWEVALFARVA